MVGDGREARRDWRPPRRPALTGADITAACTELRLALAALMAAISETEMLLLRLTAERDGATQGVADEEVDHGA